ncbi:MAG: isoaspartyl peptidase/L-asparaginase [Saprospiraceae bacterium]|nr:isoaspartyl peptidase/L-asparaginase [Candidatus Vicinibacter affinis]
MDQSNHVFFAGEGAEEFPKSHQVELKPSEYFTMSFLLLPMVVRKRCRWKKSCLNHFCVEEQKLGKVECCST